MRSLRNEPGPRDVLQELWIEPARSRLLVEPLPQLQRDAAPGSEVLHLLRSTAGFDSHPSFPGLRDLWVAGAAECPVLYRLWEAPCLGRPRSMTLSARQVTRRGPPLPGVSRRGVGLPVPIIVMNSRTLRMAPLAITMADVTITAIPNLWRRLFANTPSTIPMMPKSGGMSRSATAAATEGLPLAHGGAAGRTSHRCPRDTGPVSQAPMDARSLPSTRPGAGMFPPRGPCTRLRARLQGLLRWTVDKRWTNVALAHLRHGRAARPNFIWQDRHR